MKLKLNKKQYFVLYLAAITIVVMCLFPPHIYHKYTSGGLYSNYDRSRSRSYRAPSFLGYECRYGFIFDVTEGKIDLSRLSIQITPVLLASLMLCHVLFWRPSQRTKKVFKYASAVLFFLVVIVGTICLYIAYEDFKKEEKQKRNIFDKVAERNTGTAVATPDIFDQVAEKQSRDIFDTVAEKKEKGGMFADIIKDRQKKAGSGGMFAHIIDEPNETMPK